MTSTSPVLEGAILAGKYRVESVLGVGGMGVVVAATHVQLHQRVALKFVHEQSAHDAATVERFLREARAAVRLRSEHVARVIDVGTLENGAPYIVMEYLEGADLGSVLRQQGAQPIERACDYVVQACEALAEAHSIGIVHRDLKPENLFLTRAVGGGALVKVLDFGISKLTTPDAQRLTQTSAVMGSPLYMSPEQMRSSRAVDARSDIWSLGVVLYELLSGKLPFEAETLTELCLKVVSDPLTPLRQCRAEIPYELERVVERCLAKDPQERYASAAELAIALEPFVTGSSRLSIERARLVSAATVSLPQGATTGAPVPLRAGAVTADAEGASRTPASWVQAPAAAPRGVRGFWPVAVVAAGGLGCALLLAAFLWYGRGGVRVDAAAVAAPRTNVPAVTEPVVPALPREPAALAVPSASAASPSLSASALAVNAAVASVASVAAASGVRGRPLASASVSRPTTRMPTAPRGHGDDDIPALR